MMLNELKKQKNSQYSKYLKIWKKTLKKILEIHFLKNIIYSITMKILEVMYTTILKIIGNIV